MKEINEMLEEIRISREKGIVHYLPILSGVSGTIALMYIITRDVYLVSLVSLSMIPLSLFVWFVLNRIVRWGGPRSSWKSPDIYIFDDKKLNLHQFSAEKPRTIDLSTVYKVRFMNHKYRKYIDLFYHDKRIDIDHGVRDQNHFEGLTAPFFEKCNDDWQRLFEEIRKRLPPDTKVIVK